MNLPDFLTEDEYGFIHFTGHRIGLQYKDEFPPEMIRTEFPTLPLALIHKTIAFYLENPEEVDAYVAEEEAEYERQAAAPRKGVKGVV